MSFANEKIVENKTCRQCSAIFHVTDKDIEFYEKASPIFAWRKYQIPSPTLCPGCRKQRRSAFRNERYLYKRKCDLTSKDIISIYSPDTKYKVYEHNEWWSDKWNALDYWKDFDFERPFFDQFQELMEEIPHLSLYQLNCENSDYINACSRCDKCYMTFNSDFSEESYYWYTIRNCKKTLDCSYTDKSENSYELLECWVCYNTHYSMKSSKCRDSYFLYSCIGCENCFLCTNLVNKKYYIFNKQYWEKEYNIQIEKLLKKWIPNLKKEYKRLVQDTDKKYMTWYANSNSTWDNIFYSENCKESFDSNNIKDCKYCDYLTHAKDCMDYQIFWDNSQLINECIAVWHDCNKISFSMYSWSGSSDIFYCYGSWWGLKNCFWCASLKNKQYCILNKQYSKEQYEILVPRIIEHMKATWEWWEFFPAWLSQFGYNETIANEIFPLTKEEIINKWFKWNNYESPDPKAKKVIPADRLPNHIKDIPDDILNWAIECEKTKRLFRIIKPELEFYRNHNLPIPKKHPDQRHLDRMKLRNPRKLYDRKCNECKEEIKTTHSPEKKEAIHCEACYNKSIY